MKSPDDAHLSQLIKWCITVTVSRPHPQASGLSWVNVTSDFALSTVGWKRHQKPGYFLQSSPSLSLCSRHNGLWASLWTSETHPCPGGFVLAAILMTALLPDARPPGPQFQALRHLPPSSSSQGWQHPQPPPPALFLAPLFQKACHYLTCLLFLFSRNCTSSTRNSAWTT